MTNPTNPAAPTAAFLLARTIRDSTPADAATFIASKLTGACVEFIAAVGELAGLLGFESSLILDVALTDATAATGERAGRCKVGSRRRRQYLASFEALCAAHDRFIAVEKARLA